jgi:LPS-assembly protein
MASLDGGLTFERDWSVFGENFVQTLEPRLFYVYIPFRNQNSLPVFDTAIDDFNFSQLFSENRYLGNDRIGDANQLTMAVTSRLLDPLTGAERLRVALGQRFYFADQRVTLSEVPRSSSSSDILLEAEGKLSDTWALQGLVQQNLDVGQNEQLNVALRYTPRLGSALNFGYRYTRQLIDPTTGGVDTLRQFDISGEWPVGDHVTLLGRWNYSLHDKKTLEAIAGVEYNQDCWILRLVFHRLATTTEQTTNSVFVQLELNGLARVGTSPLDLLRRSVPGYLRTNDPSLLRRDTRLDPLPDF